MKFLYQSSDFVGCFNDHGLIERLVIVSIFQLYLTLNFVPFVHDDSRCAFVGFFKVYFTVAL